MKKSGIILMAILLVLVSGCTARKDAAEKQKEADALKADLLSQQLWQLKDSETTYVFKEDLSGTVKEKEKETSFTYEPGAWLLTIRPENGEAQTIAVTEHTAEKITGDLNEKAWILVPYVEPEPEPEPEPVKPEVPEIKDLKELLGKAQNWNVKGNPEVTYIFNQDGTGRILDNTKGAEDPIRHMTYMVDQMTVRLITKKATMLLVVSEFSNEEIKGMLDGKEVTLVPYTAEIIDPVKPDEPSITSDDPLSGEWIGIDADSEGHDVGICLAEDGEGAFLGKTQSGNWAMVIDDSFSWTAKDDVITVKTSKSTIRYTYALYGDRLVLINQAYDSIWVLTRK